MKIYKFKDLSNSSYHSHFLQIIQKNKIWCASPDSLNDKDEFRFRFIYEPTQSTHNLLSEVISKLGRSHFPSHLVTAHGLKNGKLEKIVKPIIDDVIEQSRVSIGVCSFSIVGSDDWLWSEYGGHGNGVRIEFELAERSVGKTFHLVNYVTDRAFHIDVFLRSQLIGAEEFFRRMLVKNHAKLTHLCG